MIRAIGWCIKVTLFAGVILVLGNWIKWGNKTVSDQVKTQISHAERSDIAGALKKWTNTVTDEAKNGAAKSSLFEKRRSEVRPQERIPSSERQKLRALIQELNGSKTADRR